MMVLRGDVVTIDFPFTSGMQSKVRPALVVQNDKDNQRLPKTIVAMMTGNLRRSGEPTHLLIDPNTTDGGGSGLNGPSLAVFVNLFTVDQSAILKTRGHLSTSLMQRADEYLRAALDLI
jgi:mRNA interferase MazF